MYLNAMTFLRISEPDKTKFIVHSKLSYGDECRSNFFQPIRNVLLVFGVLRFIS